MKSKMLAMFLLAGSSLFARPHFVVGVGVGGYRPYGGYYAAPVAPVYPAYGPGYVAPAPYVAPPFAGAIWVGPRWVGGRYFRGHWGRR
jgi:hypothetical protein